MNNDLNFTDIGNRIQSFRQNKNLTQEKLAERVGTNQKYISRIEAGNHRFHFDTAVAIARALNISVDALIADHSDSMDESNLQLIMNDIRGMSKKQLEVLKDNIKTIKKFIE